MIKSMTGYGGAKAEVDGAEISVELKSVNNRFLDTSIRLPRNLLFAEESVKSAVSRHISRGKVDVFVNIKNAGADDTEVAMNEPLIKAYLEVFRTMREKYGLADDVTIMGMSRLPDVLSVERRELDRDEATQAVLSVLEEALTEFDAMRLREGAKLRDDVQNRIAEIERLTTIVEENAPKIVSEYRLRLEQKMREVLENSNIDESRLITEAAIFADKVAVDEETVRLRSHLSQLTAMISGESPVGRKIDFLVQELNREANTIGSKCQSADIAHVVVDLKSEIEKIREQIQNVE